MPIINGYCELEELKAHIMSNGGGTFTDEDDINLESVINAVSRGLDATFDTTFYARTETRYFTPQYYDTLYIPDLLSVTTLKTDDNDDGTYETTWATTDYWLEPRNAQASSTEPKPYRQISARARGERTFPKDVEYGVEIAGSWGYSTKANQPAVIKQFTLLFAHRLWRRKDAIFGIAGTPALGVQVIQARIQQDSDLMQLLQGIDRRAAHYGQ